MTTVEPALLRVLHRMLRQQQDLRDRIARGPKQVLGAEEKEARYKTALESKRAQIKELKLKADRKQLELKEREQQIAKFEDQLNGAATNKEYSLLQDQIKATKAANDVLSDEILEILEGIDQAQSEEAQAKDVLSKAEAETEETRRTVDGKLQKLEQELKQLDGEVEERQKTLPTDILVEFQRILPSRGENTLAVVEDNTCGHCYQTITSQMRTELAVKKPVYCKSCGALLYNPAD